MALPTYDKSKRKKSFERLPKDAYVVMIKGAKEEPNRNGGGSHLTLAFDIAEGEYKGFYQNQYDNRSDEDKKWPNDAKFYVNVPDDNSASYVWDNWNTFFADLEDSNNGFVFGGSPKELKGKLIGGKFHIEQTEYNGRIYDHTRLRWTCVASDVRNGSAGRLPDDKLLAAASQTAAPATDSNGFMSVPEGTDEEIPF